MNTTKKHLGNLALHWKKNIRVLLDLDKNKNNLFKEVWWEDKEWIQVI